MSFVKTQGKSFEIILVDDGSTDATHEVLKPLTTLQHIKVITLPTNQGKGAALKAGITASSGDYIVFTDADLPYELSVIQSMLEKLSEGYDLVIGSRDLPRSRSLVAPHFGRTILSYAFSALANIALLYPLGDTQCGIKGFRREAARRIFKQARINGFCCDVELLYLAQKEGYRIARVPVKLIFNAKTGIRLPHMLRILYDVVTLIVRNRLVYAHSPHNEEPSR